MKNKYKLLLMVLCFALIFSMSFVSCHEEPETPQEEEPPAAQEPEGGTQWPEGSGVTWEYDLYAEWKPYMAQTLSDWSEEIGRYGTVNRRDVNPFHFGIGNRYWSADALPPSVEDVRRFSNMDGDYIIPENYAELWCPGLTLPAEPYSTVLFEGSVYYCYTKVSQPVYDFLEGGDTAERTFLIRFVKYYKSYQKENPFSSYAERDAALAEWCAGFLPDAEVVPGAGYVLWQGTAEELLSIAAKDVAGSDYERRIYACFPEDFADMYGFTVEQAQAFIESGDLDMWCNAPEGSPLYGMTHEEIAAYLAQQASETE